MGVEVGRAGHGRERIELRAVGRRRPAVEREVRGRGRVLGRLGRAEIDGNGAVDDARRAELRSVAVVPDDREVVGRDRPDERRRGAGGNGLPGRGADGGEREPGRVEGAGGDHDLLALGEGDGPRHAVREERDGHVVRGGLVRGGERLNGGDRIRVGRPGHVGDERNVVFGDHGGHDAGGIGEADALDDGRVRRLHPDRVDGIADGVRRVERDAVHVVERLLPDRVEDHQQVVRRALGGRRAEQPVPRRAVERVVGGGRVAGELRDREAGAGLADVLAGRQRRLRALGDLEAGLDADHLARGRRRRGHLHALHPLREAGDVGQIVRREPLRLALRVEAAGQVGGALGLQHPVDGLVPGQVRERGDGVRPGHGDRGVRVRRDHRRRGGDRRGDGRSGRSGDRRRIQRRIREREEVGRGGGQRGGEEEREDARNHSGTSPPTMGDCGLHASIFRTGILAPRPRMETRTGRSILQPHAGVKRPLVRGRRAWAQTAIGRSSSSGGRRPRGHQGPRNGCRPR